MLLLDKVLRTAIRERDLKIIDADGRTYRYGVPGDNPVTVRFTDKRVAFDIARDPRLGAGETYIDGRLVVEPPHDIRDLVDLVTYEGRWDKGGSGRKFLNKVKFGDGLRRRLEYLNWQSRSKRNVAHHYDLSDRLYELFLDDDRQYSCAYFTDPGNSLEQAQADKKAHIAAKLHLSPGQKVLDIGCGWGGTALYLNRVADVDVLGVTLSEEQLKVARRRAAEAGVADRVRFELIDYRAVEGHFDRIVSIGMFEHVGPPNYRRFFAKCKSLLTDDGVMLLHTIGRMGKPGTTDAFTTKYIFPGGYNPALSEIVAASEKEKLIATDVETLRLHYALTIEHWYARTNAARAQIEALYDERFFRLWQFYLAGAMAAFRNGGLVNYQLQYARKRLTLPITRDYLATSEAALKARAGA